MKKSFIIFFFILLPLTFIFSDIQLGPSKNKDVGGLVGRIYMYIDKPWGDLDPGYYYSLDVYIENIATKKQYKVVKYDNGYFCLLNIPPGQYILKKLDFYYEKYSYIYYFYDFKVYMVDNNKTIEGINFGISKNYITTLQTIFIYVKMMPNNRYLPQFKREEGTKHLIDFFKKIDSKNKWAQFEFANYEVE